MLSSEDIIWRGRLKKAEFRSCRSSGVAEWSEIEPRAHSAGPGSVGFFVCRSVYFWLIADTSLQLERTTNWRPDLSIIAPGRWVARMPGTGTLRRSSTPARIKAIVGKSRVAATRLQRLSFVFGALAMIGCTFFRSPRQRIFDQSEWQTGWPPVSKQSEDSSIFW